MKKQTIIIIFLLALCLVLCLILIFSRTVKEQPKLSPGIETYHLQQENDSLKQINLSLDYQLSKFSLQTDSLHKKLADIQKIIQALKLKQHEKLNHFDSLNSHKLYGFFSKFNP